MKLHDRKFVLLELYDSDVTDRQTSVYLMLRNPAAVANEQIHM